jgi:Lon protease-like protein
MPREYKKIADLPTEIPVFPLDGVLLLPRARLPLNLFEPRYVSMLEDALMTPDRFIGIVQPRTAAPQDPPLYAVACAGHVSGFSEAPDGRYLITLDGVCRMRIVRELDVETLYRQVEVDYSEFAADLAEPEDGFVDRDQLLPLMKSYARLLGVEVQWELVEQMEDEPLLNTISMLSPFDPGEKQALLEAPGVRERAALVETLVSMAVAGAGGGDEPVH